MADHKIGAGIALDGEKDFKKAVSGINKDLSVLGTEMQKVTAKFSGNEKSMESLTVQSELYNRLISTQREKIIAIQKALNSAKQEYGENSVKVKNWQISLNKAETELLKTEKALESCNNQIDAYGKETNEAENVTSQLSNSMEGSARKASVFGDVLKANLLSDAIMGGLKKLGDLMQQAAGKFIDFAKDGIQTASDLQEVQNVVDTTFGKSSQAIDKFAKSAATAYGMSELSAKKYTGTMGAMLKSMGLSESQVSNMSIAMAGLSGDMASFYNLSSDEAFEKIRAGISGETEPLKQLGINMSVANLEAYALSQGIETSYKKMTQAEQATLRYNYLMQATADAQGDFSKTSDSFANQQRIMQLNIENLGVAVGSKLLPVINTLVSGFNSLLSGEGNATDIGNKIGKILADLSTKIAENMPNIINTGMSIVTALLQGIINNLPQIIQSGIVAIQALIDGLTQALPLLLDGALQLIIALAEGMIQSLPVMIPKVMEIVLFIVEKLLDNLDLLIEAAVEIVIALAEGIVNAVPLLLEKLPVIIYKIINALIKSIPKLLTIVPRLFSSFAEKFRNTNWGELGKSILDGIINGISNAVKNIGNSIKKIGGDILNSFKKVFGINSPSRVFRDNVGKFLADGIGVGFVDEMNTVSQKMTAAVPTNFSAKINAGLNNLDASDNGGIYNVINIDGRSFASVVTPYISRQQYTALGGAF